MKHRATIAVLALLVASLPVTRVLAADPPAIMNYQGVLRDSNDVPQTGTFDMVFRFFDDASAGSEILVDSHTGGGGSAVNVSNGLFSVALGGGTVADGMGPGTYTALDQVFRDYGTVWLEIAVGAETLTPRTRIQAAAYALNASNVEGHPASSFIDVSASAQTKSGRLSLTPPDTSAGYALYAKGLGTASVLAENNASGQGYLAFADWGVWGQGNAAGGYFQSRNGNGSAALGYGSYGVYANGSKGGYFYDNGGDQATLGNGFGLGVNASGTIGGVSSSGANYGGGFFDSNIDDIAYAALNQAGHGYGLWASGKDEGVYGKSDALGGHFFCPIGSGEAWLAEGTTGVRAYGYSTGGSFSGSGSGSALLATGEIGIDAQGRYPGAAGHFKDNGYTGEAWLANGNAGIVAKGNYEGGEFSNTTTGSLVELAPNNGGGQNSAGYFYNPQALASNSTYGVWTYIADASAGSFTGLTTNGGKNFIQNHPLDPTRAILYTALEGGEAGTYTRGSGIIEGGRARIPLEPTFALTTDPDVGLTAVVSPRGAWADLYVESVSTSELVVASRDPGASGVAFDYLVNGIRLGFENAATIVPKDGFPNATVPPLDASEERLATLPEDARGSTPLVRFSRNGAAGARASTPTLAHARALVAAIDAPEQAEHALPPPRPHAESMAAGAVHPVALAAAPPGTVSAANGAGESRATAPAPDAPATGKMPPDPGAAAGTALAQAVVPGLFVASLGETVESGDLLSNTGSRPGEMVRSAVAADAQVVGIVAGDPGATWTTRAPLAPGGSIVSCNVDASFGAIAPGDLLVASVTPGHAMRAGENPRQGTVVAKAIEPLDTGTGSIKVLVMSR